MACWFLGAGFVLLLLGCELAARGGVGLARDFGVPPLSIGLFVLSTLGVMPELFVSTRAAAGNEPDLALGVIVGGVLFALLFVLGIAALIRPMAAPPKVVLRDGGAALLASLALIVMAQQGKIGRCGGAILLAGFILYLALCLYTDWRRTPDHSVALARALARSQHPPPPAFAGFFLLLLGLIGMALGAHFAVSGVVPFAKELKVSAALAGLTLLAAGTALPKLLLTASAAIRGQTTLAVGQMLTASAFGLLGALGIVALIHPLTVSRDVATYGIYVLAGTLAILLPLMAMRWRLTRPRALLLLVAYLGYLAFLVWRQGLLTLHGLG
jgi:cation:H+ antiporter